MTHWISGSEAIPGVRVWCRPLLLVLGPRPRLQSSQAAFWWSIFLFPCVTFAVQVGFHKAEELDRLVDEAINENLLSRRERFGGGDSERSDFEAMAREMAQRAVY